MVVMEINNSAARIQCFGQRMAQAWNQPTENERNIRKAGRFLLQLCTYLNFRCHHFDYTAGKASIRYLTTQKALRCTTGPNIQRRVVKTLI